MEAVDRTASEEHFDLVLSTRQLLLMWNAELKARGMAPKEGKQEQEVGQVGSRVLKCVLKMVQNRLLEDTHKYVELQEQALDTSTRIREHEKCIARIKEKLRLICSMSEEANGWMDEVESEESSPSPSNHDVL